MNRPWVLGVLIAISAVPLAAGPIVNVALSANGGVASQSSNYDVTNYPASNGNDGNNNTFSHTQIEFDAWWRVDFLQPYYIVDATVINRVDCCWDRISPFNVYLLDAGNNVVWQALHVNMSNSGPDSAIFSNINTFGSAFEVQLDNHTNYLHLGEVVVDADLAGPSGVPEPATWLLLASVLPVLAIRRRFAR
jgi:hypothetical protein